MEKDGRQSTEEVSGVRQSLRTYFFAARLTRRSLLPLILVGVNLGVYAGYLWAAPRSASGAIHPVALLLAGAKVSDLVLAGEWWRLFSSVFLHADLTHLLVNCLGVFFLAQVASNVFGWVRAVVFYVLGGAAGALLSTVLSPDASVGASGAIYSLLGASTAFGIAQRRRIPPPLQKMLLAGTMLWVGISLVYAAGASSIDNAAHVGGALAGAGLALVCGPNLPVFKPAPMPTPWLWKLAAVSCGVAMAFSAGMSARGLLLAFELPAPTLSRINLPGISLPYPTSWSRGRLSGTCKLDEEASLDEVLSHGSACFKDPYGATLLMGRAEDLAPGLVLDPSMTLEYGLKAPLVTREGDVSKRLLMLNRKWAVGFLCYEVMAHKYDGFVSTFIDGVDVDL